MEDHLKPKSPEDTEDTELAVSVSVPEDDGRDDDIEEGEEAEEENANQVWYHTEEVTNSDPTSTLLHNLVVSRHYPVLRHLHELKVDVDPHKVALSWFSEQKVTKIVKITENTAEIDQKVCKMLENHSLFGGLLVGKTKTQGELYTSVSTGKGLEYRLTKLPETKIAISDKGVQVSFEDFGDGISGRLNKEGFLEHATMVTESEKLSGVFVGHNMFVNTGTRTEESGFEGYVHNVAEQQIANFPRFWQKDAASTLRNFENKFFTSKFQLIFQLSGYFETTTKNSFKEVENIKHLTKPYEVHKIMFESSEPVGPLLKARGRFKILLYDKDSDGQDPAEDKDTQFQDLDTITALCTRTGRELYFEHCSMGDWKIAYVRPGPDLIGQNLKLLSPKT